jgi:bifunctional UDP-N-acetylglucosamine pyrophosphorylase/glucosamine-1-phosphate N-acetyltransferase
MKICAVIPAAGRGTRLNSNKPKLFTPVIGDKTIWDFLSEKLFKYIEHIHIINSPWSNNYFEEIIGIQNQSVTASIQLEPLGMGDAIFSARKVWANYDHILIVWGDQIYVSNNTIRDTIELHSKFSGNHCTIPLVKTNNPYVDYLFSPKGNLVKILQSREGDIINNKAGVSDVGTFLLSTQNLINEWDIYLSSNKIKNKTGEQNFLPFLPWLSSHNWHFEKLMISDINESRGINTQEDLFFFRDLLKRNGVN